MESPAKEIPLIDDFMLIGPANLTDEDLIMVEPSS
jgi:hypothetical protein